MLSEQKKFLSLLIYVIGILILPLIVITVIAPIVSLNPNEITSEEALTVTTTAVVVSYGILASVLLLLTSNVLNKIS